MLKRPKIYIKVCLNKKNGEEKKERKNGGRNIKFKSLVLSPSEV